MQDCRCTMVCAGIICLKEKCIHQFDESDLSDRDDEVMKSLVGVFLTDGDVPMDNNASERAIRGFCVGKKNWQMIDTINGAKSSAIIYSIAETAKANNFYVQKKM